MQSFLKYNWPSALWAAFILYLCLLPGKDLPSISLINADKLAHFTVYFILALLTYWGWQKQSSYNWPRQHTFIKLLLLTFGYGFLVEVLQELITADRHFDLLDATANGIGAMVGCMVSAKWLKH